MTPTIFDLNDGKGPSWLISDGASCHSMAVREFASAVMIPQPLAGNMLTSMPLEDFALMEASCGIVRIIQTFPNLRLPPGYSREPTGQEKQALTIVISSADGCKVQLQ